MLACLLIFWAGSWAPRTSDCGYPRPGLSWDLALDQNNPRGEIIIWGSFASGSSTSAAGRTVVDSEQRASWFPAHRSAQGGKAFSTAPPFRSRDPPTSVSTEYCQTASLRITTRRSWTLCVFLSAASPHSDSWVDIFIQQAMSGAVMDGRAACPLRQLSVLSDQSYTSSYI